MKGKAVREADRKRRAQEARERENKKVKYAPERIIENLSRQRVGGESLPLDSYRLQDDKRNTSKTLSEESKGGETKPKYPIVRKLIFLFVSAIVSAVVGSAIVWEVPSADPIVRPPAESLDPQNPFAAPFTVFNKLHLHTLYHVQTSCYFDKRSTSISNVEFVREADVANISPSQTISYTCSSPIGVLARPGISIVVRVQYEIRILSLFSRRGEIEVPFPLREGPKGEFHWVEGGYITRIGPEIWNGM